MIDYKILNNNLSEYLEDATLDDFKFIKSLNDIALKSRVNQKMLKYNEKIDLDYNVSLAYTFFKYISDDYACYFEQRLNDGTIRFSNQYLIGQSYYDGENRKRVVEIPITKTIEDAFVMVHEVLHDMNLEPNFNTVDRMLYTETISMLGEILFEEFLIKYNLHAKDGKKNIHNMFASVSTMAESNDFDLNLIGNFISNGYVDINCFNRLCSNYNSDIIEETIESLINNSLLQLEINQKYIIGSMLSCYMHDRIKNNPKYLSEFIETNSMMTSNFFESLIYYLDLDIEDNSDNLLFTKKSLKILEKSFKKEIKNR